MTTTPFHPDDIASVMASNRPHLLGIIELIQQAIDPAKPIPETANTKRKAA